MSSFQLSYDHPTSNHNETPPAEAAPVEAPTSELQLQYEPPKELLQGAPLEELPEAIAELRADPDRKMYSAQHLYGDAVRDFDGEPEEVKAFRAEGREVFCDMGVSPVEAKEVVRVIDDAFRSGPPDDAVVAGWEREAVQATFRRYGREAEQRLSEARALVTRDPRVKQFLNATGLGSHPRVVELLIEKARSERGRGRLR